MLDISAADVSATTTDSLVVTPEVRQDEYMQLLRVAQLHRVDCTRIGHPSARDVGKTYREGHIRGTYFGGEYKIRWMNLRYLDLCMSFIACGMALDRLRALSWSDLLDDQIGQSEKDSAEAVWEQATRNIRTVVGTLDILFAI